MKNLKSYYTLNNIANIFPGYTRQVLRKKQTTDNKESKQLNIVNFQNVRDYSKGINIDDKCEVVNFKQEYSKEIKYMEKGDIIMPIKSGLENSEIIYIDKEPEEKYIYDSTILVIRVTDINVDSRYVYIMMSKSEPIQNGLKKAKYHSSLDKKGKFQSTVVPRLSKGILSNILIRQLPKKKMEEVVNEYIRIKNAQQDFLKKISEMQVDEESRASIWWITK